jgi:signal transduction histidine kinase
VGCSGTVPNALGAYAGSSGDSPSGAAAWSAWLASGFWLPALLLVNVVLALYPTGRLPDRRWRLPFVASAAGVGLLTLAALFDSTMYHDIAPGPSPLSSAGTALAAYLLAAVTLVPGTVATWVMSLVRVRRSQRPERQQLAWLFTVVLGVAVMALVPAVPESVFDVTLLLVPVAVGVGVFRHNLLGIETVLRRGLVFAALTALIVAIYLAVTVVAGTRLDSQALPAVTLASLIAVALMPLRGRVQSAVDRLVYGSRPDPLTAVTDLGELMADEDGDLLAAVLSRVTDAVRSPGAVVKRTDGSVVASLGRSEPGPTFPLRVGGSAIGFLEVAARSAGEPYAASEERLLSMLVPQVAVVCRALDLSEALEAERDRVLDATKAERERLQRDLHDGLAPSLSGVRLGLVALQDSLAATDDESVALLAGRIKLEADVAVVEVRRIIDGLRPAVLDEIGLAAALRRQALLRQDRVRLDVHVAELPDLAPGLETAVYRIAEEAVTNVTRHALAEHAWITLDADLDSLRLSVRDDGRGFDSGDRPGMGFASMRKRAVSMGGSLEVGSTTVGTQLVATLPIPRVPQ